jgi:hypothetical protein
MFGVYDGIKKPLIENYDVNPNLSKSIAGIVAGTVEAVLMVNSQINQYLWNNLFIYFSHLSESKLS